MQPQIMPITNRYFVYHIIKKEIVSKFFTKWDDADNLKTNKNDAAGAFIFDLGAARYTNARLTATDPGGFKVPHELGGK